MNNYVYIGQYYHRHGKDISSLTEKKIGLTKDLSQREQALNPTKFTIGYAMVRAWEVDDMSKVEGLLHAVLDHNRLDGEWFEDEDDSLISRVSKFMRLYGSVEVIIGGDTTNEVEQKIIKSATSKGNRDRVDLLVGETFSSYRRGKTVNVTVRTKDDYYCHEDDTVYNSGNKALHSWLITLEKIEGYTASRPAMGWWNAKNSNGQTPDDVIASKI